MKAAYSWVLYFVLFFKSIQEFYIFWLENLIHLFLKLLLIVMTFYRPSVYIFWFFCNSFVHFFFSCCFCNLMIFWSGILRFPSLFCIPSIGFCFVVTCDLHKAFYFYDCLFVADNFKCKPKLFFVHILCFYVTICIFYPF